MALEPKPQLTAALMPPSGRLQPGHPTQPDETPFTSFPEAAEITLILISGHWLAHPSNAAHGPSLVDPGRRPKSA